jgi:5'-nucleotidase
VQRRPFFLLTNDDGIHAPGLQHLYQALATWADIAIVAPQSEKSGCGLSITWAKPLRAQRIAWQDDVEAWSLTGTPADCVRMAFSELIKQKPDMVLSGVNRGANSGRTVLYSGTVGGAIEATFKGIKSIAFSFLDLELPPLGTVDRHIEVIVRHFLDLEIPKGTLLNVNFPLNCATSMKGIQMAKQGQSYWIESPDRRIHPEGFAYYWLGGKWDPFQEKDDSEITLLDQGFATVVPIQIEDLTNVEFYHAHRPTQFHLKDPLLSADSVHKF